MKIFDLCAGDGAVESFGETFHEDTSPGILAYHAQYLSAAPEALPVDLHLYETSDNAYYQLRGRMKDALRTMHELPDKRGRDRGAVPYEITGLNTWQAGNVTVTLHHESGAEADLSDVDYYTAVLVSHDPNSMNTWPLSPEFLARLRDSTSLAALVNTMGCNVSGAKRLTPAERAGWYQRVQLLNQAVYGQHDTLIARIENDSQQWAYAFTVPYAFARATEDETRKAFRAHGGFELDCAWLRRDPFQAQRVQDLLFKTKAELEADARD